MNLKVISFIFLSIILQETLAQKDSLLLETKYCPGFVDNRFILRGIIYDSIANEELPAATIYIKGTKNGSLSDEKGQFSLDITKLLDSTKTIVIIGTYVGYKTKEIEIKDVQMLCSYLSIPMVNRRGISCPGVDVLPEKNKSRNKKKTII